VGGGVCPPECPPHFVWKGGTASGAFGPLGAILGQKAPKKNNFGPKLWANFFHLQRHRGGHPGVPRGSVGCVGVWGSPRVGWAVGVRMGWGAVGWVGLIDFLAQNEMEKN